MKKQIWKNGNGEILGFAITAVAWVLILTAMIAFSFYTISQEQLTAATYSVGRAAVISNTLGDANSRASAVLKTIYGAEHSGTTSGTTPGYVWFEIKRISTVNGKESIVSFSDKTGTDNQWEIGSMAQITLHQAMPKIFPFNGSTIDCSISMMVETQMFDGKF